MALGTSRRAFLLGIPAAALASQPWLTLLHGDSEDAWVTYRGQGFPDQAWDVHDGVLHAKKLYMQPCVATRESFTDFDLEFDWKIAPAGNSGVFYCNRHAFDPEPAQRPLPDSWHRVHSSRGQEYQICDDAATPDARDPKRAAASLYGHIAPLPAGMERPALEWNTGRIVVRDLHAEHWLNGNRVVAYDLKPEEKVRSPIVLQHHHTEAWFRNIRIQRLV
jgi:hypothetical protein